LTFKIKDKNEKANKSKQRGYWCTKIFI